MWNQWTCIRQKNQTDCGAAALATVAQHYRLQAGIERIRDLVGTDHRQGSGLLGLVRAAESLGFDAKGAKADGDGLMQAPLPLIAQCSTGEGVGRLVVVHRVDPKEVLVADPACGILRQSREEFGRTWTGVVLLLTPKNLRPRGPAPSKLRLLAALVAPHRRVLGGAILCAVLYSVLGIATSVYVQHLVDTILVHGRAALLDLASIGMIGILVLRCLFSYIRGFFLADTAAKVDLTLVSYYLRHVLHLPLNFFETRRVGEILSRVSDAGKIRQAISATAMTIFVDGTMIVVATAAMVMTDLSLASICLAFVPVFVVGLLILRRPLAQRQRTVMEQASDLQSRWVEDVSAAETIKANRAEEIRGGESESKQVRLFRSILSSSRYGLAVDVLSAAMVGASMIATLWLGGHRVIEGAMTVGTLMFFYTLVGLMFGPLERLSSITVMWQDASVALDRMWEILSLELEESGPKRAALPVLRDSVRFERVGFQYGAGTDVLKGLDLTLPIGKVTALIGESGAGKSTVCKLLSRFYDPVEGRITADGIDLREMSRSDWRERIGYVPQEPKIFRGTIAENIALAHPDAELGEIVAASRLAGLHDFIQSLPRGYSTPIGERGTNLSGGQKQRLAIARAVLRRPEILVFDEATSHLDLETEQAIQRALREGLAGKTVLLIAHRLSTIRHADYIAVLRAGRIVEAGTHDQLIEQKGRYWQLAKVQALPEEHYATRHA